MCVCGGGGTKNHERRDSSSVGFQFCVRTRTLFFSHTNEPGGSRPSVHPAVTEKHYFNLWLFRRKVRKV